MPEVCLAAGEHNVLELMIAHELAPSRNEGRRLIQGGGVKLHRNLDGSAPEKVADENATLNLSAAEEVVLQVGKRKFLRVKAQ